MVDMILFMYYTMNNTDDGWYKEAVTILNHMDYICKSLEYPPGSGIYQKAKILERKNRWQRSILKK